MTIAFSKMHGLGNDFMVLNNLDQQIDFSPRLIRQWADRHWGIGFDQLLVVEPAKRANAQFSYRIFNADGGEVAHCGNGARCFARYVLDHGLTDQHNILVDTLGQQLELEVKANGNITVMMGVPTFAPDEIPMRLPQRDDNRYELEIDGFETPISFAAMGIGNPHAVITVARAHDADVTKIGQAFAQHDIFPESVNVGFLEIIDRRNFNLRVYERGVGETQACGTGACAAAACAIQAGKLEERVTAHLMGGNLEINWAGKEQPIYLSGPATEVFRGELLTNL